MGTWQAATGGVTGSGTTSYIPKFSSSTAIGNSAIYDSSGSIGIGTTSPGAKLHIVDGSSNPTLFANDTAGGNLIQIQVNGVDKFVVDSTGAISVTGGLTGGWVETFTASADQTAFNFTSGTYAPGSNELLVFRNGALQLPGSSNDYVETDSDTITFNHKMSVNEVVFVQRKGTLAGGTIAGDITGVTAGSGLTGGGASGAVTLDIGAGTGITVGADSISVDVGTTANKIVQLDGTAKLPAVDGSQLTNVAGTDTNKVAKAGDTMTGTLTFSNVTTDITTGSNEHLALMPNGTGNVGIGTTGPLEKLHIEGSNPALKIISSGTGNRHLDIRVSDTNGLIEFISRYSTTGFYPIVFKFGLTDEKVRITEAGNVGIGTTGPLAKLSIGTGSIADGSVPVQISAAADSNAFYGANKAGGYGILMGFDNNPGGGIGPAGVLRVVSSDPLKFVVNNTTQAMTILSGGNVGIGTTGPLTRLDIAGPESDSNAEGNAILTLRDSGGEGEYERWGFRIDLDGDLNIDSESGQVDYTRMVFDRQTGNVGIGTTGPLAKLSLYESTDNSYALYIKQPDQAATPAGWYFGADNTGYLSFAYNNIATTTEKVVFSHTGNVGIGTTSPGYTLTVSGTAWCTSGAWSGSDLRWKENIYTLIDPLQKISRLRSVEFNWKRDEFKANHFPEGRQIGLIAQELEKEFPELVTTDQSGYKAIAYDRFTAVLLEAIKAQQGQIQAQNERIRTMEVRISKLES